MTNKLNPSAHSPLRPIFSGRANKGGGNGKSGLDTYSKQLTETDRLMLEQALRQVASRTGSKSETMTLQKAMIMKTFESALNGNSNSQRLAFMMLEKAELKQQIEDAAQADYWRRIKVIYQKRYADDKANDLPDPKLYPHPDDIEITSDNQVNINGPLNEVEATAFEDNAKLRDLLIVQDSYESRKGVMVESGIIAPLEDQRSGLMLAMLLNAGLPNRYQITPNQIISQIMAANRYSKRQLETMLYKAFKKPSNSFKRGQTLSPLSTTIPILKAMLDLIQQHQSKSIDIKTLPLATLADMISAKYTEYRQNGHQSASIGS